MEAISPSTRPADGYWLTRFVILRWLGFVYLVAFYVAARQLVPLVGGSGLTPGSLFLHRIGTYYGTWGAITHFPSLFWMNDSDWALQIVAWLGVILSGVVLAGYANALIMFVLWIFYLSIVNVGQEWYGYGWEIQLLETGFLAIFLCPLLDARPFPLRPPPFPVIVLFRWLIVRIMLGSALIKLRGDPCWHNLTALYTFFETQPIPNPLSRWFHFLPHPLLQFGAIMTYMVELGAPWLAFGPRWGRYIAGGLFIGFQFTLILSGNFSFFNWLTIVPALACFDDRFWRRILPVRVLGWANQAQIQARPSRAMIAFSWAMVGLVAVLSIQPVLNLVSSSQRMNSSFDPLYLVNTYGAFGSIGLNRGVIIFEGSDGFNPGSDTDWKEYSFVALPCDPARMPVQIAPYQPHLDWQLWFAAMGSYQDYPWTVNLVSKLLHNDPATLGLFAGNPFPDHPPRYIRAVFYKYNFAAPGNPERVYWTRQRLGLWLPPLSTNSPDLKMFLAQHGWR